MIDHIWEGIYPHLRDVPRSGKGFDGDTWVRRSLKKMEKVRREAEKESPCITAYNRSVLPVVAAMAHARFGALTVVDFGGGIGANYFDVVGAMPDSQMLSYHVVEMPEICVAGRKFFHGEDRITFHEDWPALRQPVNLVHMGSSIQYVEDWQAVLKSAAEQRPSYLLFSDLIAGDIPTYASAQMYYESTIPMWFFNRAEFVQAVGDVGYVPVFMSRFLGTFLGEEQEVPQENFPESHRLRRACHMLFIPVGGAE